MNVTVQYIYMLNIYVIEKRFKNAKYPPFDLERYISEQAKVSGVEGLSQFKGKNLIRGHKNDEWSEL